MAFTQSITFQPFEKKVYLASPTMHGEELEYMKEAYETNWMSTVGKNINEIEAIAAKQFGMNYAVAVTCGTAALHLCIKLAAEQLYGKSPVGKGTLAGKRVFCSDMTFTATVNPVAYEGGTPVFIDTEADSWNMDPAALEKAFTLYPDVKLVIYAELYGFTGNIRKIKEICEKHGAMLIEDAAEAVGAYWEGRPCASFGDLTVISYNGNKIITGSAGGCLLCNDEKLANTARKWSTQAREDAPWYQHEEVGYNYRISNVIAGVIRAQYPYLAEHIARKKAIYERYRDGLKGLPITMNPIMEGCKPNYWLSAFLIDKDAMCCQIRGNLDVCYASETGKSCPTEILNAIASINAEGRPIWKPLHLQPMYSESGFVTADGQTDVGADIFARGVCLPSDIKMTEEQQNRIIEVIRTCFS